MEFRQMKCTACGAPLIIRGSLRSVKCEYCGTLLNVRDMEGDSGAAGNQSGYSQDPQRGQYQREGTYYDGQYQSEGSYDNGQYQDREVRQHQQQVTRRNSWLIVFGMMVLITIRSGSSSASSFAAVVFICAVAYFLYNRRKNMEDQYYGRNQGGYSNSYSTEKLKLPWYFTGWGIFLIGLFTYSIYWIIGPFLRMRWKRKWWGS